MLLTVMSGQLASAGTCGHPTSVGPGRHLLVSSSISSVIFSSGMLPEKKYSSPVTDVLAFQHLWKVMLLICLP